MSFLDDKVTCIDGKYYLELPCAPGATIYNCFPTCRINSDEKTMTRKYIIDTQVIKSVEEILRWYDYIGRYWFLTEEECREDAKKKGIEILGMSKNMLKEKDD